MRTLAAYFASIEGATKVKLLENLAGAYPYGAIGLSTASVSARALSLVLTTPFLT